MDFIFCLDSRFRGSDKPDSLSYIGSLRFCLNQFVNDLHVGFF